MTRVVLALATSAARRAATTAAAGSSVPAAASAGAVSALSPTALAHIETRWTRLPEAERGAIADQLAHLQQGDWKKMTLEQKRVAYYIAYGPYGARLPRDPAFNIKVASWVAAFCVAGGGIWIYWESVKPKTRTITKEWQEASDKLSIERKMNPFSGPYAKTLEKKND